MGADNNSITAISQKDASNRKSASLEPVVFQEIFIVPDTKEVCFFETFEDSNYEDFKLLLDKQQELAKANEEVKKASIKVNEDRNKEKKKAAGEFKKQVQLNMDEELKVIKTPKIKARESFNNAVEKADKAFVDCDKALEKATGGSFKALAKETVKPVEVLSLTRNRPILLAPDKFEEIKSKAKVIEEGSKWKTSQGTDDNDFMGLVRSLKNKDGEYDKKTINSAFKKVNGSVKLADWPKTAKKEGNASFGNEKLAKFLENINEHATASTNKDKVLSDAIKKRLDDTKRKKKVFTVDDAEYVITSLRDLYVKTNEETPADPKFVEFVTKNLGQVQDTYNEDPNTPYYTVHALTNTRHGSTRRKELLAKMDKTGVPTKMWDASASAKIMRYAATAGGSATCDLTKGVVNYTLKAEAKLDLVDAKAETNCYLPSDEGAHVCFSAMIRKKVAKYNKPKKIEKDDASFFHDSSFVAACTAQGLLVNLNEARKSILNTNVSAILDGVQKKDRGYVSLVGKTDKSGSDSHNNKLSRYRVFAAYAFIYKDVDAWFYFFKKKIWGETEANYMIKILCADKDVFDKLEEDSRSLPPYPMSDHQSSPAKQGLFSWENHFNILGSDNYPSKKYTEYFERIPEGKMANFGSSHSRYNSNDLNWENVLKKRIKAYFKLVHSTIELKESIKPINTTDLLITRGNLLAVGESQATSSTPNKSASDRTIDVLCYTIKSVHEVKGKGPLDFGHIRILFKGYLTAWAGVEASVTAGLEIKMNKLKVLEGFQPKELTDEEKADVGKGALGGSKKTEKGNELGADDQGGNLGAAATAFAGAKASAGVKAMLEWQKPETNVFSLFAEAGYSVSGMAGAGASADFKVGYDSVSGKFVCKMKAEATLGVGCGGAFSFAVGADTLIDFVQLVYQKLADVDFSFLDIFETETEGAEIDVYKLYSQTLLELIKSGNVTGTLAAASVGAIAIVMAPLIATGSRLAATWDSPREEDEKKGLEELATCIKKRSDILAYLNPETKGRLLYLLSKYSISSFWDDVWELDWNHENEVLALNLIETGIKSKRDYEETISHMVDFKTALDRSKNRNKQKAYASAAKSIDDDKSETKMVIKQNRIQMGEKWLKDILFNDFEDCDKFDKLTKKYK